VKKELGILEDSKLNVRHHCALTAKTNSIRGCINRSSASRAREVIILLYSIFNRQYLDTVSIFEALPSPPLIPHPPVQERHQYPGESPAEATKMLRELEHLPCEERLRELICRRSSFGGTEAAH